MKLHEILRAMSLAAALMGIATAKQADPFPSSPQDAVGPPPDFDGSVPTGKLLAVDRTASNTSQAELSNPFPSSPQDAVGPPPDFEGQAPTGEVLAVDATASNTTHALMAESSNMCSPSPHTVYFFSACLSDEEMRTGLTIIRDALVEANPGLNEAGIRAAFSYAVYWSGQCMNWRWGPTDLILQQDTSIYEGHMWFDVAVGTTVSLADYYRSMASFVKVFRVCGSMNCAVAAGDSVIPNVASLLGFTDIFPEKKFCPSAAKPIPLNFLDESNAQQCECCAVGEQCACPNNQVVSRSGDCICPSGKFLQSGECADSCFQIQDSGNGFVCSWSDPDKSSLTLDDDCNIKAPHADDNYVADKRINQGDADRGGPIVSMTVTTERDSSDEVAKATWHDYASTPGVLEGQFELTKFGVYDLSMAASDYKATSSCSGCLAVVDNYPPTAKQKCQSAVKTSTDYSQQALSDAIATESAFTGFYNPTNIKNNGDHDPVTGDNERCDSKSYKLQDFFADYTNLATIDTVCFDNDYVTDLVEALPETSALSSKTNDELNALSCKRCCKKSIRLKEYYYDYQCGVDVASAAKKIAASDSCALDYCVNMPSTTLLSASVSITDDASDATTAVLDDLPEGSNPQVDATSILHRSIICTAFDTENPDCAYKAKLKDLFETSATWLLDGLDDYTPADHVFWRYKFGAAGDWTSWSDDDEISVDSASATISVEAWSHCGFLLAKEFTIVVHLHTSRDICPSLLTMWTDLSDDPRTDPEDSSIMCAYKDSDFVALKYSFVPTDYTTHDINTVAGYYSGVTCYVTIAKSGETDSSTEATLSPNSILTDDKLTLASAEAAYELVYDPSTFINTDIKVRCEFTYTHFGGASSEQQNCDDIITVTDCDDPTLSNEDVCGEGVCEGPDGPPGLYEACDGSVYTADGTVTTLKELSGECCEDCAGLTCTLLGSTEDLKRCEVVSAPGLLTLAAASMSNASVGSFAPLILCASALVAIVALVAVKRRGVSAELKEDDVYYPLRD